MKKNCKIGEVMLDLTRNRAKAKLDSWGDNYIYYNIAAGKLLDANGREVLLESSLLLSDKWIIYEHRI